MPRSINKKTVTALAVTAAVGATLVVAQAVLAIDPDSTGLGATAGTAYGSDRPSTDLPRLVGGIIRTLLSFIGVVFLVLLIWAGSMWMTASGDETKVKKAKLMIGQAVAGMIVIFAAYAITSFVVSSISSATDTVGDYDGTPTIEETMPEGQPPDLEQACTFSGGTWDGTTCNY